MEQQSSPRGSIQLGAWPRAALLVVGIYLSAYAVIQSGAFLLGLSPMAEWLGLTTMHWLPLLHGAVAIGAAAAGYGLIRRARRGTVGGHRVLPVRASALTDRLNVMVHEFSLLYEIGQEINATIELTELLEEIPQIVRRHLALDEFAILLLEESREALRVQAAFGFPHLERIQEMVFQVGEGVCGEVARTGRLAYLPDTRRNQRYLHYRGEHRVPGSFLAIPLRYKKEVLGVINFSRRGVGSFTREDIRLLTLVANQIALAIANAKLYTRTRELSVRDDLTGLYNRRYFQQAIQVEWKRAVRFHRPLSALMIDVDRFKVYNDTFGHLEGDHVLKHMAKLLQRNLREVDTLARFGGEEFVVLLPDTDRRGAIAVGEKLRQLMEQEPFPLPQEGGGHAIPLTVSIGIATYPDDVREIEDLIDHADIALYDAKDTGRNRVICYPPLPVAAAESNA